MVKAFWDHEYAQTGDREKQEMIPFFSAKFGPFITNTTMRNIIGQTKSAFNLRQVMDEEKVLRMVMRHYDKHGAMLAVIGEPGDPVAYCLSILDEIWYAAPGTMQLLELSLFVHPDHRRTNYAKQLMNFMKQARTMSGQECRLRRRSR